MTIRDTIHSIFEVKEPHELPAKMMKTIQNPDGFFIACQKYREAFPDLQHDYLRDYFQENQADRSNLMQDYTPESICKIVAGITGRQNLIADLCAGTGSLTLEAWKLSPDATFICYEISSASVPFLLFNLAVRNIHAFVVQGDLLTEENEAIYEVIDGKVIEVSDYPHDKVDAVITNPPYSLKWSGCHDLRFGSYPAPPKSVADYAFILIGLNLLKETGIITAIMPHGVLFRGSQEGKIRSDIIKSQMLNSVIGLPDKLFANTQIPVCLMVFKKSEDGLLVINADREFKKQSKQNLMEQEHIDKVLSAYRLRTDVDKLSRLVRSEELEENEYNLNIPRYVTNWDPEPIPDVCQVMKDMIANETEIRKLQNDLLEMLNDMAATDETTDAEFREYKSLFEKWVAI